MTYFVRQVCVSKGIQMHELELRFEIKVSTHIQDTEFIDLSIFRQVKVILWLSSIETLFTMHRIKGCSTLESLISSGDVEVSHYILILIEIEWALYLFELKEVYNNVS